MVRHTAIAAVAFAAVLACSCSVGTAVAGPPAMPASFTGLANVTVWNADGKNNFLATQYRSGTKNATLQVTWAPIANPYQLFDGAAQTFVSFNPAPHTCDATCAGGDPCTPGGCNGVPFTSGGLFGGLYAMSHANGTCSINIGAGSQKYILELPVGGGATLYAEWCFMGTKIIYALEEFFLASQGVAATQATNGNGSVSMHEYGRRLEAAKPTQVVLVLIASITPGEPPAATFDVPNYCPGKCKA